MADTGPSIGALRPPVRYVCKKGHEFLWSPAAVSINFNVGFGNPVYATKKTICWQCLVDRADELFGAEEAP